MKRKWIFVAGNTMLLLICVVILEIFFFQSECQHNTACSFVSRKANCTKAGQKDILCSDCGTVLGSIIIKPFGHTPKEPVIIAAPTCTKAGHEDAICSKCQTIIRRNIIEPLGHIRTKVVLDFAPTCTEIGSENIVCSDCGTVIRNHSIEALGHSYGDYILVINPTAAKNGLEVRTCRTCNAKEEREYVCPHDSCCEFLEKKPTCVKKGKINIVCEKCGKIINQKLTQATGHVYGDWVYTKSATPVEKGKKYRECTKCGNKVTESYEMRVPDGNYIYAPDTGICHNFTISSFTQSAVNRYDIVYSEDNGYNNPFILGHNTGTMRKLSRICVGQSIYVSINGKIETYTVIVSECGRENEAGNDIIGKKTGVSIWKNYGCRTLHLYTCYGYMAKDRWMVLATLNE